MNAEAVLTALLTAAILSSVAPMLAAVGEAVGEKSGLLNLGIEGVMAMSAFVAFWTTLETGSYQSGLAAGLATGLACGIGFGVLATAAEANQVVLGLGLTLAGTGGSAFLFRVAYGSDQPLLDSGMGRPFAGWGDWLPVAGPALFNQRWFVYVAWLLVIAMHLSMRSSLFGLRVRAAGELPIGLEAVGGSVWRVRIAAATIAGGLSGLAGASLVVVELGFFSPGVTGGVGFLAVALAMLGRLSPLRIVAFCLGFGLLAGLDTALQVAGADVRPEFLQMLPYLGVVLALVAFGRHSRLPAALGLPWRPGGMRT